MIISGDNVGYISKELGKIGIENKIIKRIDELDNYEIIFGIGNIKGFGFEVIDYYKKEKDR